MARSVNKKFVTILAATIAVVVGGVAGLSALWSYRNSSPVRLANLARAAVDKKDYPAAIAYYNKAAENAAKRDVHLSSQDWERFGRVLVATSPRGDANYSAGLQHLRQAIVEDRNNKSAREFVLQIETEDASRRPNDEAGRQAWGTVQADAQSLIDVDPKDAWGQTYLALANRKLLTTDQLRGGDLASIEDHVKLAMKLDPKQSLAVRLMSEVRLDQWRLARAEMRTKQADKLRAEALNLLETFCAANPGDVEARMALAQAYTDVGDRARSSAAWARAVKDFPDDSRIYLARAHYFEQSREYAGAQQDLEKATKLSPTLYNYYELGKFFEWSGHLDSAVGAYNDGLAHAGAGGGGDSALANRNVAFNCNYWASSDSMDLAARHPVGDPQRKALMDQAATSLDRAQQNFPSDPRLNILQGRLHMVRGEDANDQQLFFEGVKSLQAAETFLAGINLGNDEVMGQFVQVKQMLALAYIKMNDTGAARTELRSVLERMPYNQYPRLSPILLQRCDLDLRAHDFQSALDGAQAVLRREPKNARAVEIAVTALTALNRGAEADALRGKAGVESADLRLFDAQRGLVSGDYQKVLDLVKPTLEQNKGNVAAALMAYEALAQLHRQKEAEPIIAAALEANPQNASLQAIQEHLINPDETPADIQLKVLSAVQDPMQRQLSLAEYWGARGDAAKQADALKEAEKINSNAAGYVEAMFNLSLAKKDFKAAEAYAQKAGEGNLDGADGKLFQGRLELARGNQDAGLRILQAAAESQPSHSMGWAFLGAARADAGDTAAAIDDYTKALDRKPDNLLAIKGLVQIYRRGGPAEVENAKAYLAKGLAYAGGDPQLLAWKADLDDLYGDPKQVIKQREARRKAAPDDVENLHRLATVYVRSAQPEKAIEIYESLYKKYPDNLQLIDTLARLYQQTGQNEKAIGVLQRLAASPDSKAAFGALLMMGNFYRTSGQLPQAVETYRQAVEKEPQDSTEAERRLGDLYFDAGDFKNAEPVYQATYDKTHDVRVFRRRVECMVQQKQFDEALAVLDGQLLKDFPGDPDGMVLRGDCLLQQKKFDQAKASFEQVIGAHPDHPMALYYHALTLAGMNGDLDQAVRDLKHAQAVDPGVVVIRAALAHLLRQRGQTDDAIQQYRQTLDALPQNLPLRAEFADYLLALSADYERFKNNDVLPEAAVLRRVEPEQLLSSLLDDCEQRFPTVRANWKMLRGSLALVKGDLETALSEQASAYELNGSNPTVSLSYLHTLLRAKQFPKAVTVASKLATLRPGAPEAQGLLGAALAGAGRQEESSAAMAKAFELCRGDAGLTDATAEPLVAVAGVPAAKAALGDRLKVKPDDTACRSELAKVNLMAGDAHSAAALMAPIADDTAQAPALRVHVLKIAAMAFHQDAQYAKAETYYRQLIAADPTDVEAFNNLAYLLAENLNRAPEALPISESAYQLEQKPTFQGGVSSSANVLDTLGWVRFLNKDLTGADAVLSQSVRLDPTPVSYYHYARVLVAQRKLSEARAAAQKSAQLAQERKDPIESKARDLLASIRS